MNLLVPASFEAGAPDHPSPLIAVRDVKKIYRSGEQMLRALDGVSFDIHEGEFVAIMGPSGSGKSTMMHLLGALDVPTAGSVLINSTDIGELSRRNKYGAIASKVDNDARAREAAAGEPAPDLPQ